LLNMIWLILQFLYKILAKLYVHEFSYKIDIVLYQLLETGTADRRFMGRDQELKWLAFILIPLLFFLYSPFKGSFWDSQAPMQGYRRFQIGCARICHWSRDFRLYPVTTILHCHWRKFWWRNTDYADYM